MKQNININGIISCSLIQAEDLFLLPQSVRPGGVVTIVDDQVLGAVVVLSRKVALDDGLGTSSVSLLSIDGGTRHVGNHSVSTTERVLGVAQGVVLGGGLREPNVTTISAEVSAGEGISDVLLDDDSTTGGVDEP